MGYAVLGILLLFAFSVIFGGFFTIRTAEVAVIERFGKFLRVAIYRCKHQIWRLRPSSPSRWVCEV